MENVSHRGPAAALWTIDSTSTVKRVFRACLTAELILVFLDLTLNYAELVSSRSLQKIFNLAHEQSLGTWFSVLQMAVAGMVLLALAMSALRLGQRSAACAWGIFSGFFLYLSADDAAKIHERVGSFVDKAVSSNEQPVAVLGFLQGIFPSYAWQWVFAPFFIAMGCALLYFVWVRLPTTRLRFTLLGAFACWGVAVILDFIEGIDGLFQQWAAYLEVKTYTVSHPILVLEEFLEMLGATLFLCVFVDCLVRQLATHKVTIGFAADSAPPGQV